MKYLIGFGIYRKMQILLTGDRLFRCENIFHAPPQTPLQSFVLY